MTFTFKLEQADGTSADPPQVRLGVYVWNPGDTITLSADRSLRVVDVRDGEPTALSREDSRGTLTSGGPKDPRLTELRAALLVRVGAS
jgi:hypothetical protein